jgi:hypothetical protein
MRRALAIFVALAVGWIVYMIAMMMTVYDGVLSMIFQPIMAVLCSGFFVGLALLVGLVLRIPFISRWWQASRLWAVALISGSLSILCFGSLLGITEVYTDHETGRQFTGLHSAAALSAYFAMIFGLANWPFRGKNVEPTAAPNGGPAAPPVIPRVTEGPPSVS